MFLKLWNHTFAADPAWFWNDRMKTVADAIKLLYIIPLFQNFKNPPTIYETIKCIIQNDWMKPMHLFTIYYTIMSIECNFKISPTDDIEMKNPI